MIYDELAKKYGIDLDKPKPPIVMPPPLSAAQQQIVNMVDRKFLKEFWEKQSEVNPDD